MTTKRPIAVISAYDKSGVVYLAEGLAALGWRIVSWGGTLTLLRQNGIEAEDAHELFGTPHREMLAALISGYIQLPELLAEKGLPPIELVYVNLKPVTVEPPPSKFLSTIDTGGAAIMRAAIRAGIAVVSRPGQEHFVLEWVQAGRKDDEMIITLAGFVLEDLSRYDQRVHLLLVS